METRKPARGSGISKGTGPAGAAHLRCCVLPAWWIGIALTLSGLTPGWARGFDTSPPQFEPGRLVYDDFDQLRPEDEALVQQRAEAFVQATGLALAVVIDDTILDHDARSSTKRLIPSLSRDPAQWPADFNGVSARGVAYGEAFDHWLATQPPADQQAAAAAGTPSGATPRLLVLAEGSSQRVDYSLSLGKAKDGLLVSRAHIPKEILTPARPLTRPDARSARLRQSLVQILDQLQPAAALPSETNALGPQLRRAARSWPFWITAFCVPLVLWAGLRRMTRSWSRTTLKPTKSAPVPVAEPAYRLGGPTSGGYGVSLRIHPGPAGPNAAATGPNHISSSSQDPAKC